MVKIYEALEQAQKDRAKRNLPPLAVVPLPGKHTVEDFDLSPGSEREMVHLYKNIENLLSGVSGKVVQFIGAHEESGTSTVARMFAVATASCLGKTAVLVEADFGNPRQQDFFGIFPDHSWKDAMKDASPEKAIRRVGDSNLYLCPVAAPGVDPRRDITASAVLELWGYLKSRFDFVVVDSAPASKSADGISMARTADGVVLVLEAEGTRRPVARNLLDAIRNAGGNVLGVVFNKRRYYIPDSIYRKL